MFCVNARFLSQRITGSQRYCVEIARHLRRLDSSIRFLGPRDILHSDLAEELRAEVVGKRAGVPWEQVDLPGHLRRNGSPLLVSMQYTAPLLYPNTIVTIHDVVFLHREWVARKFHYWYRFLIPRVARKARKLVTVSEFSKGEIVAKLGVPEEKIEVVHCAVSPEFARQAEQISDNPHGRYIMGAATLNRRKNLEGLIRSFLGIEDRDVKLIVVGASDARIYGRDLELGELLRDERIVLTGYVTDAELASLYRNALAFVYPSLYEGFGIPPLEAMSLGCPVITSNTASLPEVCGDAAHYVDPRDVPGITDAIDLLLRDEAYRRELSAKGIERAKRYDWKRSAERFLEIARGA